MEIKTITTDGDYSLPDGNVAIRQAKQTSVIILSNPDAATITFGLDDGSGNFVAYTDGVISTDKVINHGAGIQLMVRISGTSSDVKIGLSN